MATPATAREPVPVLSPGALEWSKWFQCESSFNLMLVPQTPGIYAVAEELLAPGAAGAVCGKRMLALYEFSAADDLSRALARLFTPASPLHARLTTGRCFLRYAVVEDAAQREAALQALQSWLAASAETAAPTARVADPAPLPAGF